MKSAWLSTPSPTVGWESFSAASKNVRHDFHSGGDSFGKGRGTWTIDCCAAPLAPMEAVIAPLAGSYEMAVSIVSPALTFTAGPQEAKLLECPAAQRRPSALEQLDQ